MTRPFWQEKTLTQLSQHEWESLCDGCGKCCLHKLEDEDTGKVHMTNVACRLLDLKTAKCQKYHQRKRFVNNCVVLTAAHVTDFKWLPNTCAYRLVSEGKDLPDWHPLKLDDPLSTVKAGQSIVGIAVDERKAGDFEDHLISDDILQEQTSV